MRYHITVGSRVHEVELRGQEILIDGEPVNAELQHVAGTMLRRLALDGASHRLVASPPEERGVWRLQLDGERLDVQVVDERTRAIRALTAHSGGPQGPKPVKAPMPGMIVRIEVNVGEQVTAGQGVVIMEAMKMENELKADGAGVVAKILVQPGVAVEKGAVLVEFVVEDHG